MARQLWSRHDEKRQKQERQTEKKGSTNMTMNGKKKGWQGRTSGKWWRRTEWRKEKTHGLMMTSLIIVTDVVWPVACGCRVVAGNTQKAVFAAVI